MVYSKAWIRALAVALMALALSCGSEENNGGGGGGGGDCNGVCSALMAASCYYSGGEDDCLTSCTGWDEQVASGADYCQEAWQDYKDCMTSEAIADCGGVPTWNVMACRAHWDHYQNYCLYAATPDTACEENEAFDMFCADQAGTPKGKVCRGEVPGDCVIGGTSNNADLYCCP